MSSLFLAFTLFACAPLSAQPPTEFPAHLLPLLEEWYASSDGDVERADLQTWLEHLQQYMRAPLSLNKSSRSQWEALGLLTHLQIECLLSYRLDVGPFLATEELQSTGCISHSLIRLLSPLVTVSGSESSRTDVFRLLKDSRQTLLMRWGRSLLALPDYQVDSVSGFARYEGSPDRVFIRFRRAQGSRFSIGLTAEKDPGESFFAGSNAHGFDFLSAHVFLADVSPAIKALALGDFSINLGQGLIMHSGFGGGKSAMVMQIARTGQPIQRYSSVDENRFFRGAGIHCQLTEHLDGMAFISSHRIDASRFAPDSVSSLLSSGLHRSYGERSFENTVRQHAAGGRLGFERGKVRLTLNGVWMGYDKIVFPAVQPYNRWYFRGRQLSNVSIDYTIRSRGLYVFGELAGSANGSLASVSGLLATLGRGLDLALCVRHLDPRYQAPLARAFTENSRAQNETGGYLGVSYRPVRHLLVEGFVDLYRHPWVRYRIDAPSFGREWRVRATLEQRRQFEVFAELRREQKWIGGHAALTDSGYKGLVSSGLTQLRVNLNAIVANGVEWRIRINGGWFERGGEQQQGWQLQQDILYKPIGLPWHFSARLAWFDTDSYDVRFYNFENGLLYQFAIPAYYGRAWRTYINVRWKGWVGLVCEARWAATVTAAGQDSRRSTSEAGLQLSWSF